MSESLPERELVEMSRSGDVIALTELLRRNLPMISRVIRRIVPNPADVEDVLQETSMKVFKAVAGFDGRSAFSTWLTRIAINNALLLLRSRRNRVEVSIDREFDGGAEAFYQVADPHVDPEEQVIKSNEIALVRAAIGRLPLHLRRYGERRFLMELSNKDVAASLGISVAAGKSRSLRCERPHTGLHRWRQATSCDARGSFLNVSDRRSSIPARLAAARSDKLGTSQGQRCH